MTTASAPFIKRSIVPTVLEYAKYFPAIGITGPRQSGKSTLAKQCFPHLPYISFENPQVLANTRNDFAAFLKKYKSGAIFDEVQNIPELLSYLQEIIDEDRLVMGRFIITGSQNFALSQTINQSLAGRIGMLTLLPLSCAELPHNQPSDDILLIGGYPGLHQTNMPPHLFFSSYIATYLERDIRQLKNVGDLGAFQKFIRLCAARIGWPINLSTLAADAGVSHTTASTWLNLLQASYLVYTVNAYHNNFGKRIIKTPKLYFYDTGIAAHLLNITTPEQLETHYLRGHLFENGAINEIIKTRFNHGLSATPYFWQDSTGKEIDVVGEWDGTLYVIEIKSNKTINPEHLKNITLFSALSKQEIKKYVIYDGDTHERLSDTEFVPLNKIVTLFKKYYP